MGVSKNNGTPKSSILIGFSIIFTIHFGGKIPLFLETSKWRANELQGEELSTNQLWWASVMPTS